MDTPQLIQGLHRDHVNMVELMGLAAQALARVDAGESSDLSLLEEVMRYMTGYPDTHHHPTEDIVFARLRTLAPKREEEIERIEAEHRDLLIKGRRFLELIEAVEDDELVKREDFVRTGRDYLSALESHMSFEETVLFPAASAELGQSDWAAIESHIDEQTDPLFGPSVDKQYDRLLRRIRGHELAAAQ